MFTRVSENFVQGPNGESIPLPVGVPELARLHRDVGIEITLALRRLVRAEENIRRESIPTRQSAYILVEAQVTFGVWSQAQSMLAQIIASTPISDVARKHGQHVATSLFGSLDGGLFAMAVRGSITELVKMRTATCVAKA